MSFDLTNKNIQDTYQNLLQKTGSNNQLYNLVGNPIENLTIKGTLYAQSYIVSESVVNTSSGSTIFGDSSDDIHIFTGSISASGNISASGDVHFNNVYSANEFYLRDNNKIYFDTNQNNSWINNETDLTDGFRMYSRQDPITLYQGLASNKHLYITSSGGGHLVGIGKVPTVPLDVNGDIRTDSNITASGDISASGTISASNLRVAGTPGSGFGNLQVGGDLDVGDDINVGDDLYIENLHFAHLNSDEFVIGTGAKIKLNNDVVEVDGAITASGNISSSGNIISNDVNVFGDLDIEGNHFADVSGDHFRIGSEKNIKLISPVTASGDISSSGTIFGHITSSGLYSNAGVNISGSNLYFSAQVHPKIYGNHAHNDNFVGFYNQEHIGLYQGNASLAKIMATDSAVIVGAGATLGHNVDFYCQTLNNDNMFYVDSGQNKVGVGKRPVSSDGKLTVFGDILTSGSDGHITASGNISASGFISSSTIIVAGSGSFGGNISASGYINGSSISVGDTTVLDEPSDVELRLGYNSRHTDISIGRGGVTKAVTIKGAITSSGGNISASGDLILGGEITASGGITASGDLYIDKNIYLDGALAVQQTDQATLTLGFALGSGTINLGRTNATPQIFTNGEITASGIIKGGGLNIEQTASIQYRHFDTGSSTLGSAGGSMGDIVKFGGSTTVPGSLYVLTGSGTWHETNANNGGESSGSLAVALGTNSDNDGMLLRGVAKLGHNPGGLVGEPLYLTGSSASEGSASNSTLSTSGDIVRVIGYNLNTSGLIYFNPDNTWVEVS